MTCADSPCYNGGTCYQNADSFVCMCPNKYQGDQCEILNVLEGMLSKISPIRIIRLFIISECPLDCYPGDCVRTTMDQYPYVCSCQGTIRLDSCEGI